jgi:hypothetical protein
MSDVYDPKKPAMVFLRPGTKARPVQMMDTIEKAGMLIDGKYAIAMYTSRAGLNQGPQGPPGTDTNSKYDTIIASCSDENTPLTTGGPKTTFRAPYAMNLNVAGSVGYIRCSLTTANTGADLIVDVTMNGTSMFSTPMHIDANQRTSVTSATQSVLSITDIPDDAEFLIYITQKGSIFAGAGLKVALTGIKVAP